MKRYAPYAAFVVGIAVVVALIPMFNAAQPAGTRLTRGDVIPIADAAARSVGIPVDQTWAVLSWQPPPDSAQVGGYRVYWRRTDAPANPRNPPVARAPR